MRFRAPGVSAMVVAAVLIAPSAAHADSTVVSRVGLPEPVAISAITSTCHAGTPAIGFEHIVGPQVPPAGKGSLELSTGATGETSLGEDLTGAGDTATDLTAFSFFSYAPPTSASAVSSAVIDTGTDSSGDSFTLRFEFSGAVGEWDQIDVLSQDLTYVEHTSGGTSTGELSWSDFVHVYGTIPLTGVHIVTTNCGSSKPTDLDLDELAIGFSGNTTTYDFEPLQRPGLASRLTSTSIVAGDAVQPHVAVTTAGAALAHAAVTLWQKPAGTHAFRAVGSTHTNAKGIATWRRLRPQVSTVYQWRFAGDDNDAAARSKPTPLTVASRVSLGLAKRKVGAGQPIVATGTVTPKQAGTPVTLWRITGRHHTKLAKAKVRHNGTYSLSLRLAKGHYLISATVPSTIENSAGTSDTRKVTVR